jgi:tetratricopeptide (TPR) repeat protein
MHRSVWHCCHCLLAFWLALASPLAQAEDWPRDQALAALAHPDPVARFTGVLRLAQIGEMGDASAVLDRLHDEDPKVRSAAAGALGLIWSRSGDAEIDRQLNEGTEKMQGWALQEALEIFNEVVVARPDFAEGWNKRATVWFLLGEPQKSLDDCEQVLQRNPAHFGALSGAGQVALELGRAKLALDYFERGLAINPNMALPAIRVQQIKAFLKAQRQRTI